MQNTRVDTVVHGGLVATSTGEYEASIAIKGEQIAAVGPYELMPPADNYIDATGKCVLPGAIDCHVHFRPAPGDDWDVGSLAAAHAGLTTLIPFGAYNADDKETLPQAIERWRKQAESESVVDFTFHYILSNTPYILDGLVEAMKMGVTSYKMFMTYDHRSPDSLIASVMEIVGANGGIMQLHAENGDVINYLMDKAIAEGRTAPTDFPATCPPWAEAEAINRAILMGKMTDCPTYIVHLSTLEGLERIKQAQREGQRVWTETCPQYLLLDEKLMETMGPLAKIGPPLRSADGINQAAMWEGSEHGYISAVASDHAPGPPERKEGGWDNIFRRPDGQPIPFGAPSIETLVPLMYSEGVVKRGLPLSWMARVLAENPARIFGLYPRKGVIQPGSDADLLIIDPDAETTIQATEHKGNSGFTPYEGWTLKGIPWMTLLRGRVLLNQGKLEQQPGYGTFLPAGSPIPPIAGRVR
ncbi:MAG: amidohydrolase family protein [Chloroflexi bacterium]|nr:amidohydrolase family protein [Chloroflexota bacterium]